MIQVQGLKKNYGRHQAVRGIDFTVQKGEIVGFLGPNGAGKTTTLRMLTGYLPPTSGVASIAGFDVFRQSIEVRGRIGYMPESVPLYDDMRVAEYLEFRGSIKGLKGSRLTKRMADVLEVCSLGNVKKKMIHTLSKGYRQRVGLADALIHEPELLILDEPTNGLDPNQIRQIRELISQLAKSHTLIISTHILSEVEMICNRVIIIDQGVIKASDTPSNLISNMRTAGKIQLEVRADKDLVNQALKQIEGLKKVMSENMDDGWTKHHLWMSSELDQREMIHHFCNQHGWAVRSLFRHESVLEDVFVELTRKD